MKIKHSLLKMDRNISGTIENVFDSSVNLKGKDGQHIGLLKRETSLFPNHIFIPDLEISCFSPDDPFILENGRLIIYSKKKAFSLEIKGENFHDLLFCDKKNIPFALLRGFLPILKGLIREKNDKDRPLENNSAKFCVNPDKPLPHLAQIGKGKEGDNTDKSWLQLKKATDEQLDNGLNQLLQAIKTQKSHDFHQAGLMLGGLGCGFTPQGDDILSGAFVAHLGLWEKGPQRDRAIVLNKTAALAARTCWPSKNMLVISASGGLSLGAKYLVDYLILEGEKGGKSENNDNISPPSPEILKKLGGNILDLGHNSGLSWLVGFVKVWELAIEEGIILEKSDGPCSS